MPLAITGYLCVQFRPGARQELDPATVEPRMHAVVVELDFMQPLVAFRRRGFGNGLIQAPGAPRHWAQRLSQARRSRLGAARLYADGGGRTRQLAARNGEPLGAACVMRAIFRLV